MSPPARRRDCCREIRSHRSCIRISRLSSGRLVSPGALISDASAHDCPQNSRDCPSEQHQPNAAAMGFQFETVPRLALARAWPACVTIVPILSGNGRRNLRIDANRARRRRPPQRATGLASPRGRARTHRPSPPPQALVYVIKKPHVRSCLWLSTEVNGDGVASASLRIASRRTISARADSSCLIPPNCAASSATLRSPHGARRAFATDYMGKVLRDFRAAIPRMGSTKMTPFAYSPRPREASLCTNAVSLGRITQLRRVSCARATMARPATGGTREGSKRKEENEEPDSRLFVALLQGHGNDAVLRATR